MEEISWLHMRPESPWYWYWAIVNRSWIHQAKVAKVKSSYIAYPWEAIWINDRPQMEISALSWFHWVIWKFSNDFWIQLNETTGKTLTSILRNAFSPDTTPDSMNKLFPSISSDFFYSIWVEISKIKREARELKNTKQNCIKWNSETDEVIKKIYDQYLESNRLS
jgi:hypothetical protein